jgi:hypothetical protein
MYGLLPISIRHENSYQRVVKIDLPSGRQRQYSARNLRPPEVAGSIQKRNGRTVGVVFAEPCHNCALERLDFWIY